MTFQKSVAAAQSWSQQHLPTRAEARATIPAWCFERRLGRSLWSVALSVVLTAAIGVAAYAFIPMTWQWLPAWFVYAFVCGTVATGVWVIAHECGHRALAESTKVQDAIGFVLHSSLLVPYFSWQRSHAIHHAKTNHLSEGETHVPRRADSAPGRRTTAVRARLGRRLFGGFTLVSRLLFGWPLYLIAGLTGGPERGVTNHFWPQAPFSGALFPKAWRGRVRWSSVGVLAVVALLALWAFAAGSVFPVLALYVGPYLVVHAWVVAYTWLQHTDVDIPHHEGEEWSFVRGVFNTVDRPYGRLVDFLHHRIGTTHVAHHLDARIPHYNARAATRALAAAFPDLYRFDPTSPRRALWRVATECHVVERAPDGWRYSS